MFREFSVSYLTIRSLSCRALPNENFVFAVSSIYLAFSYFAVACAILYLRIYIFTYNERKNIEISCGNCLLDIYNCDPISVGFLDPGVYVGMYLDRSSRLALERLDCLTKSWFVHCT